jgi:alpha-glucosidase
MYPALIMIILYLIMLLSPGQKDVISVTSPDGKIMATFLNRMNEHGIIIPYITVSSAGRTIIEPSPVEILTEISTTENFKTGSVKRSEVRDSWINQFGEKRVIPDSYNEAEINYKIGKMRMSIVLRAYNEGVAFAYKFPLQSGLDSLTVTDEKIIFRFVSDHMSWSAPRAQALYRHVPLSQIDKGCERPLLIEIDEDHTIALAEAKLVDYARMKFNPDNSSGPGVRTILDSKVRKALPFQSPWRVIMAGRDPGDLLEKNYLLLNLNDPCAIPDVSWIRPGKALREVTLTTEGAKAAVDFVSSHNMQYVEFDAGWYGPENSDFSDARAVNLDPARSKGPLNLGEVISYAKSKGVGVLLYVNRRALEKQIDDLLPLYRHWGVDGIKFGFVQVGNQNVTKWLHESIKKAAGYKLVADVHDEYRPTGFQRTYPNFLTMEGIRGDEESPPNSHTLITMFTRMLAGQGDNTICYYNERVANKMGSHASQLAKAVCLFSPLQFLYWYDKAAPGLEKNDGLWGTTNYIGSEPELEFFDNIPTVWDETRVLHARIGEYGVIARRKGSEWFVGGINGTEARTLNIDFSFLEKGKKYKASVYSDDPSVNTRTHVRIDRIEVDNNSVYKAVLGANRGIAMRITE